MRSPENNPKTDEFEALLDKVEVTERLERSHEDALDEEP